jgi:hypothetical protein
VETVIFGADENCGGSAETNVMAFMDIAATVCWADQDNREKVRLGVSRALRGRSPDLSAFAMGGLA